MKKYLFLTSLLAIATSTCIMLSSCMTTVVDTDTSKDIPEKEQNIQDTETSTEDIETPEEDTKTSESTDSEQNTSVPEAIIVESVLEKIGGAVKEESEIDHIALSFIESIKNADSESISLYVGGESENYNFIKDAGITDVELIPIDINQQENSPFYGWYDHCGKYLCIIKSNGSTDAFPSSESYYFLATDMYSATGNEVCFFIPYDNVNSLYNGVSVQTDHRYFIESFLDNYCSVLSVGRNNADSFDFNNTAGFHFIPHMMRYYEQTSEPHSYSMTQINNFIAKAFSHNSGISLESAEDYDIWVSVDTSDKTTYGDDDKIYGCNSGHGATSVWSAITDSEISSDGITISVSTYADMAYFLTSKKMVFHFDIYDEESVPNLLGINVKEDSTLGEARYAF